MNVEKLTRTRPVASALAAAALLATAATAVATAAPTGKPLTGTWSGFTSQDVADTDVPFSKRITVTAFNGRLNSIATTVRIQCTDPAVEDIRVLESFGLGRGPRIGTYGAFSVKVDGVSISGQLGAGGASGRFNASKGGCSGTGSWSAARRH